MGAKGLFRVAWAVSPMLLAITALGRLGQNAGQTTYPLVARNLLHLSNTTVGEMGAVAGVAAVGCATQLVGRSRSSHTLTLIAVGQFLGLVAFVILATPTGSAGVWAAAVALGAGGGLAFPALMTAIAAGPAHERAKALAVFSLALSVSLLAGPLIEAGILRVMGDSLRATFAVLIPLPAAATATSVVAVMRQHRRADSGHHLNARPFGQRSADKTERFSWREAPAFKLAVTVMLTYQVPFSALIAFGALLARNTDHTSAAGAEIAFGVFFAVSFAIRGILAFVSMRQTTSALLAVSVVATVVGVALLASARGLGLLLTAVAVLGIPHGATFPLASGILAERTPRHHLAAANGRLMASANAISIVVPLLSGWLASKVGYPHMFLSVELPVVVMGAVLLGQLRSSRSPLRDHNLAVGDLKLG